MARLPRSKSFLADSICKAPFRRGFFDALKMARPSIRTSSTAEIARLAREVDAEQLKLLERALSGDPRKGVVRALESARKRIAAMEAEVARIEGLYSFEEELTSELSAGSAASPVMVGLDEVGRGSMAGPLAVGAVVLPRQPHIAGLDDSKRLAPEQREVVAAEVMKRALCWHVEYVEPHVIDELGMTASLKRAFLGAVAHVEESFGRVNAILLDGNPLRLDPREVNVVKGDSKCASIAAASVVAKVHRDHLMDELSQSYPQYGFDSNKGYGTQAHRDALAEFGLTDIHRRSFCMEFLQESLF